VHQGSGPASWVVGSAELEAEPPAADIDPAPVKGMLRCFNKQRKKQLVDKTEIEADPNIQKV
jgi:hypothetical protein